ncbi:MAG: M48 family metalloprotease [Betaproteobacteria bacterium]
MKKIISSPAFCALALALSGCAGMPDMSKTMGSSIANMVPGGSKFASVADSAVSVAKDVGESQKEFTDPQEVELGENVMAGVLGAAQLYDNDRIQRYVNEVGRWVASHSERPNLPWRFAVLNSKLPNAGAAPGGQIYITTGLLFRMRSESELAGALAHEVAHVVQRHHVKAYQKQKLGAAGVTFAGAVVDQSKIGGAYGAQAKTVLKLGIAEVRTMILLKLDRGEEEQADRMGMVLAARAGYDPFGLVNVLQLLQDLQKDEGGASLLYETHPTPADRIASLDAAMGKEMEKYSKQATVQDRFITTMIGAAPPAEKEPAKGQDAKKTPPAKARAKPKT